MKLVAALCLGLTLLVSPFLYADCGPLPRFKCTKSGKKITCLASNIEHYNIAPEWNFYLKRGIYRTYSEDFDYYFTPEYWAMLEMKVYCNLEDQPKDQNKVLAYSLKSWVRVCGNRAVFARYIEGIKPPTCKDADE